jgi:hypothetical protein
MVERVRRRFHRHWRGCDANSQPFGKRLDQNPSKITQQNIYINFINIFHPRFCGTFELVPWKSAGFGATFLKGYCDVWRNLS